MAIDFNEQEVKMPSIIGSSTINHAARVKLLLNCSEYVLMDYIVQCVESKTKINILEVYRKTGFNKDEQKRLLDRLISKGFVMPVDADPPEITSKWGDAFGDIQYEFENLFWRKDGKVFFPGNKKQALKHYIKIRKKYPKEFMIEQRNQYARFLDLVRNVQKFQRNTMIGERFIGHKEEFLCDWKEQADAIDPSFKSEEEKSDPKNRPVTSEERRKIYEQDNND